MKKTLMTLAMGLGLTSVANSQMVITEWMYSGISGEYIEFSNVGLTNIDMTGWSYSDSGTLAGAVDLSAFGIVAAGQSVILTEASAASFILAWNLSGVSVIGDNVVNLGRGDTINLWDATDTLADTLSYADNGAAGGPRTQNVSGITAPGVWGTDEAPSWFLSAAGDGFSATSTGGDIGNPGVLAVPEPTTGMMLVGGASVMIWMLRRRNIQA